MSSYQGYQQDDDNDDGQQPDQDDQQRDDQDDDNLQGQQQDNDDGDNDSQGDQNQQQRQEDDEGDGDNKDGQGDQNQQQRQGDGDGDGDNKDGQGDQQQSDGDEDDHNNASVIVGEVHSDDEDNNNADPQGQSQDDKDGDDNDNDDDEPKGKASQQQDDLEDAGITRGELEQADNEDNDQGRPKAQDDDDDDGDHDEGRTNAQDDDDDDEQKASISSNMNINYNIELKLDVSELHKGGIVLSKKLLAQLFSGPGEDDPDQEEVPIHKIQHEHLETADSGEWTILELKTQDAKGANMYLKAKLDSGADDNFMSEEIHRVTGLELTVIDGPEGPPSVTLADGQQSQVLGEVRLEYTAGKKPERFIEPFQVLKDLYYDVILGKSLITRAHMMMVNPNFANPPDHPALCVVALPPRDKDSREQAAQLQKQKDADKNARYFQRIDAKDNASKETPLPSKTFPYV